MNEIAARWMKKAEEDLKVIGHELKLGEEEAAAGAVCFHAQQAAEKYLKAFLIENGKSVGKTHDIALLIKLCAEFDPGFEKIEATELNYYAVKIRYPDDIDEPDFKQAVKCGRKAGEIIDFVKGKLK